MLSRKWGTASVFFGPLLCSYYKLHKNGQAGSLSISVPSLVVGLFRGWESGCLGPTYEEYHGSAYQGYAATRQGSRCGLRIPLLLGSTDLWTHPSLGKVSPPPRYHCFPFLWYISSNKLKFTHVQKNQKNFFPILLGSLLLP